MNKRKIITTIVLLAGSLPLWAQSSESSAFSSTNMLLGISAVILITAIIAVVSFISRLSDRGDALIEMRKLKEKQNIKPLLLFGLFAGSSGVAMAQDANVPVFPSYDPNTVLLLILNAVLLIAFIYLVRKLFKVVSWFMPPVTEKEKAVSRKKVRKQSKLTQVLTDAVPVEREEEIMLDHEYDGIRELDNNLPPWWLWLFYATIIYAVVYLAYYHVLPFGKTQTEKYYAEMERAEEEIKAYMATVKDLIDENTVEFMSDASDLAAGKKIYDANCMACHAMDGGGGVGPNLTDEYWLHGGSIKDIFRTVKYGVPTKGMIAWESQLTPVQMAQVSSYIKNMAGTTPANPKEPQGEIWKPEEEASDENDEVNETDAQASANVEEKDVTAAMR